MEIHNNPKIKSFLGTGWSFPPTFDQRSGAVEMVTEEADIHQSLFLLFSTSPGERLLKPAFGCDLHSLVFDALTPALENRIIDLITTSVLRFEPRVITEDVSVLLVDEYQGRIDIEFTYIIRLTNSRHNIVYPFYFQEGTNVHNM